MKIKAEVRSQKSEARRKAGGFAFVCLLASCFLLLASSPAHAAKNIVILTKTLPQGQTTVAYSVDLGAKFGAKPYLWSVASGALPTGLAISTLGNSKGRISGTPTVAGTYNFVVQVVGGTTDTQSLFIIIAGTAPPPTPSVSITTTSLPDGIVDGAYSATLQASGGTAPYSWALTADCIAPGCALPPAAALTAGSGAIAGTLTAAGTYNVKVRVTDSSPTPQTFDRALTVNVAQAGTYLFSDNFESGNFAAWDYVQDTTNDTVQSSVKHAGTYAAQIHYAICGDSTNPACGASNQDKNLFITKYFDSTHGGFSNGLTHFFTRGYFRLHANAAETPQANITTEIQRKLYFFKTPSSCSPTLSAAGCWSGVLTTDEGVARHGFRASFSYNAPPSNVWSVSSIDAGSGACSGGPWFQGSPSLASATCVTPGYQITLDAWYYIEIEIDNNSVGLSDGAIRVWAQKEGVDPSPVLIIAITNAVINGPYTDGIKTVEVGVQANRFGYDVIDEERYWDDMVINLTGPIGP